MQHDKETALHHQDILHRRSIAFPIAAGAEVKSEPKTKKSKVKEIPNQQDKTGSPQGDPTEN